ncbi:orotate phosphoribosyltransferase [Hydrocarboniphaga effusa]|jgi:orotate phosphoribosyltransferase|uniref:orotate phosphoribosyltransferase n=1 Tax=Hydrocarboniphaga effusa TaxID=243629 RepID=UPI003137BCEE
MLPHQTAFLELALEHEVLKFGSFTLKSGRVSPYFFNLGKIAGGAGLRRLAHAYADALIGSGLEFDLLFGPAYKGIPLVAAIACALAERGCDVPFAYNRKEAKDHGEGGVLVGADVKGKRVIIVDDVLTAGTALRQSFALLKDSGATPVAAMTALDRQEVGPNGRSAVQELTESGLPVKPLVTVRDLLAYLTSNGGDASTIEAIRAYQAQYGVKD